MGVGGGVNENFKDDGVTHIGVERGRFINGGYLPLRKLWG